MKKRQHIVFLMAGAAVGIVLGVCICVFCMKKQGGSSYSTPYYEVLHPYAWEFEMVSNVDTITNVSADGERIGSITVYPQSEYGYSSSSIVANIYGMHAYLKAESRPGKDIPGLAYCIWVSYEATVVEQIKGDPAEPDELHYIYVYDDGTIIDFGVEQQFVNSETLGVMESVKRAK